MKKFQFSTDQQPTTFTGRNFYNVYKEAEFLRSSENIETILSKGYELRQSLKSATGDYIVVEGMTLERGTPLIVKKTGPYARVEDFEFTLNRLTGLVAAYAFENRHRFPVVKSSEATTLGLTWDNTNDDKCRLYLSAVSGTEHFYDQFYFWPLLCALRKLQLTKITPEPVEKMARIKNNDGERLVIDFKNNLMIVSQLWTMFPGATPTDLKCVLANAPPQLKRVFSAD